MVSPAWLGMASLWGFICVQRLVELRVAKQNEAWARAQGAHEVGARHYPLFVVLHVAWLVAWPMEAWLVGPSYGALAVPALAAFCLAQMVRYWAIRSLGRRWNTRILVIPGRAPSTRGPYRLLPHPNYVAVCIELAAVPALFGAWWTLGVASALNLALLLLIRIPLETRALKWAAQQPTQPRGAPAGGPVTGPG